MLDLKFIRENKETVRKNLEKRNEPDKLKLLDEVLKLDEDIRDIQVKVQEIRKERNIINQEINKLKKEGKNAEEKLALAKDIPKKLEEIELKQTKIKDTLKEKLMRIPNLLHDTVPFGSDESGNVTIKEWGEKREFDFPLISHGELAEKKGLANFEDAARVSGNGFYYLLGNLALLEHAIQRFAIDIITKEGYTLVSPPLMMRREPYEGVTDLADFDTMMYKVDGEELHLIATSEHPMAAMHMKKTFDEKDLPIKYCGISTCFRKEIGSHGVDEKGLFRVHQFNKIEQFIFCKPEESWKFHEELLKNAETIFQKLKLPYRIINICTGDIGIVAAKKYDMEVWMPREKEYKEVVSCSNCTSYQAVRLGIKYRKGNDKEHINTLNSTAVATSRVLRAIIENYQEKDRTIRVPEALVPYMNGIKEL